MRRARAIGLLLVAACGGGGAGSGAEPQAPAPGAEDGEPARHELDCLPRLDGTKIQARLPRGHTLRDLVLWYGAITCNTVLAPRSLLLRQAPEELDEVVPAEEVDELFRAEVARMGLAIVRRGDFLVIVEDAGEALVFAPRRVGREGGGEEADEEEAASRTGIPACDDYLEVAEAYMACDQVPKQAREAMKKSLDQMEESWGRMGEAGRETAAKGCRQGSKALKQAAKTQGCEL